MGTSETVGEFRDLFEVLDRKSKLYQRTGNIHGASHAAPGHGFSLLTETNRAHPKAAGKTAKNRKPTLRELTEQALLQEVAPTAVLVNSRGDILYLHGRTGMYLEPVPGEADVSNILKMAREGLRRDLTTALHKAASGMETISCLGLLVKTNGDFTRVNLTVKSLAADPSVAPEAPLYLVILTQAPERPYPASLPAGDTAEDTDVRIDVLQQELRAKEEYLQSAFEELETSNEELQSVNEELATVNAELQTKVADLSQANNDMNNLLAGTGIGTVFVDHGLHILRFTPAITRIINLIHTDVGRPVGLSS